MSPEDVSDRACDTTQHQAAAGDFEQSPNHHDRANSGRPDHTDQLQVQDQGLFPAIQPPGDFTLELGNRRLIQYARDLEDDLTRGPNELDLKPPGIINDGL